MLGRIARAIADRVIPIVIEESRKELNSRNMWMEFFDNLHKKAFEDLNTRTQRAESLVKRLRRENYDLRQELENTKKIATEMNRWRCGGVNGDSQKES